MEDIKKIQEFFSKPLNENVYVEAFKLEKALKGMGYDVKVKAVDDFGENVFEIYFNNPADADDDSIFYDAKKLGYDNVRVFANPQESLTENGDPIENATESNNIDSLHKKIEKYYGRKLEPSQITTMLGKDNYIANLLSKYKKLSNESVNENKPVTAEASKGALNYFSDLKYEYQKAFRYLDVEEREEYKQLVKDFFSRLQIDNKVRAVGLDEYETGIYYKGEETKDKAKDASKSALEKVKDMIQKVLKEEEGYSQFLKTDDNPEGKTKGLDTATMNKILMNVIKDLDELKQLGEGVIEEELCAKGKAYIKKRQAAGEKSSAYLSGRAVKVCKGQMKG